MWAKIRSRKYLQRILLSLTVFIVVILCVFASTLYLKMKSSTLHIQTEANRKVLAQVKYNVEYMDEILKNLMMSLYFDNEVIPILYSKTFSYETISNKLAKLDKLVDSSTYLHSIILYNNYTHTYLSTNRKFQDNLHGEIGRFEQQIQQLENQQNLHKMQLIPFKISNDSMTAVDFFSYVMNGDVEKTTLKQSTLILNVNPEWLFNNIKVINDLAYDKSSSVLLMDGQGNLYTSENRSANFLPADVVARIKASHADFESFTYGKGNNKSIVTVMSFGMYQWKAVSIQSYHYTLSELKGIRNMLVISTVLFLLLSAVIAYIISRQLYRPVERMIMQLKGTLPAGPKLMKEKDEWSYLSDVYASMIDKTNTAEIQHARNRQIVEGFHIRNLLTKSGSLTKDEFLHLLTEHDLAIDADGPFMIGVCQIDDFETRMLHASADDQKIYRFALGNIAEELLSPWCKLIWIEMGENHFVFLASLLDKDSFSLPAFEASLKEIQQVILRYYQLSTTISYAAPFDHYLQIAEAYSEAQELIKYRMIFGHSTLLSPERVKVNERHEDLYQATLIEKQIIEHLRRGNSDELMKNFHQFFIYAISLTYTQFMHAILHMTVTVTKTISEMNENRSRPIAIDLRQFYKKVLGQETVGEIEGLFHALTAQLTRETNPGENDKTEILCHTMKEIIAENCNDPDFSLQTIAQLLKMSSAYIGRVFKQGTGTAVTEYINQIRLNNALVLLEAKDISITEVMERVGYRSQSYFFKLFKAEYGTTPKDYRLRKVMGTDKI
ncbi:AraC family transcriptional regulator [Paenibacillus sp. N3.4]|uniref:AraC family transcriptional regulator n=1 Tax=Paenibacillus sp. N3.4 TaxID=2603222 RepID=UPI00165050E6|nr:helix-turn-helix domain-containing protein [Paenibacillus sp. N3.4]